MSAPPLAPPTVSDQPIWSIFTSAFHCPAMVLADELGLFSALADGPATAIELAPRLGVELRAIETIAGLMAALGLLVRADGRFHLTDVARAYLLPTSPYYWGGFLRRIRDNPLDAVRLLDALRRGQAAAEARLVGAWQASTPPAAVLVAFTHAMHAHSFALAMRIAPVLGLTGAERLLDVAGGSGAYAIAAAFHAPTLRATVLDLAAVCEVADRYIAQYRLDERVSSVAADMFNDPWPTDHDRVLFSDIFHDWDDERCAWLAARARVALRPGGRVLIHEMILSDSKDGPIQALAYSMAMIFTMQGRQRTAGELLGFLEHAGFVDLAVAMTAGGYAVVSGAAP